MIKTTYTLSVLLVEDEPYKVSKIGSVLKEYPYIRLEVASNQLDALTKLENEKFDLLILDMQLPIRTGEDTLPDGGERILVDLETYDTYIQPNTIVVLTQYEELQESFRSKFEDVAATKFKADSEDWHITLDRIITRCVKSKNPFKKIVYCEGNNAIFYNLIGFKNIEFRGLADCRAIFLAAINEQDKFALRDRDFLTDKEIQRLQKQYTNYYILQYYCFENYLYHPDNILEVNPQFNTKRYINEIRKQKNEKLMTIIQDYKLSRNAYTELITDNKLFLDKSPEEDIVKSLQSDDFETFYKYFDMAGKKDRQNLKSFDKNVLMSYNFTPEQLSQTKWFKNMITKLLP